MLSPLNQTSVIPNIIVSENASSRLDKNENKLSGSAGENKSSDSVDKSKPSGSTTESKFSDFTERPDALPVLINGIENILGFIWLGSELQPRHIVRLQEWVKLNPDYIIRIDVEAKFIEQIKKQVSHLGIIVEPYQCPKPLQSFTDALMDEKDEYLLANYAAVSDVIRFYNLFVRGGWYCDLDIKPFSIKSIKIDPELRCVFNGRKNGNGVLPDVIGVSRDNQLTKNALRLIVNICSKLNNKAVIAKIKSRHTAIRRAATEFGTGSVTSLLLMTLLDNEGIPMTDISDFTLKPSSKRIIRNFKTYRDMSWLRNEDKTPLAGLEADAAKVVEATKKTMQKEMSKLIMDSEFMNLIRILRKPDKNKDSGIRTLVRSSSEGAFGSPVSAGSVINAPATPSLEELLTPLSREQPSRCVIS